MERIKVSDLAKEMGLPNKDMEIRIKDLNIFIDKGTIHSSDADKIRELIKGSTRQESNVISKPTIKRKSPQTTEVRILKVKNLIDAGEKKEPEFKKTEVTEEEKKESITPELSIEKKLISKSVIEEDKVAKLSDEDKSDNIITKSIETPLKEEKQILIEPYTSQISGDSSIQQHLTETLHEKSVKKDIKEEDIKDKDKKSTIEEIQTKDISEKKELKVVHFEKRQPAKPKEITLEKEKFSESKENKKVTFTARATDRKIQLNKPFVPQQKPNREGQVRTDNRVNYESQQKSPSHESRKNQQTQPNKFQKLPPKNFKENRDVEKKETLNLREVEKKNILTDIFSPKEPSIDVASISNLKQKRIEKKKPLDIGEDESSKLKTPYISKKSSKKHIVKFISEELDSISDEILFEDETIENIVVKQASPAKKKLPKQNEKITPQKIQPVTQAPKQTKRKFTIYESIQVGELAKKMSVKASEVIMKLMSLGVMATVNQTVDFDTASLIASEFGFEVEKKSLEEDFFQYENVSGGQEVLRPPVVTVMGHVDHGKTSLLDAIRHADVASREAGGITQHIGAYHVKLPAGNEVVFLDTPGHEAFTQMRARGAKVTDIVLLVVAADDGVMAQTREAIDHAREAKVPIIVAINKIDKPEANIDRVKKELADIGLIPEDWGGDTIFVNISAKKRIGIEELIEMLSLQAEVLELKAIPERPATGHVIEARLDKGRGPVATLLVSNGTLKMGDAIVCGVHYGKVRAMINDKGENVTKAGPSMPVEVLGLSDVPEAGNEFFVVPDEKKAREISENRQRKLRETELAKSSKITLENMLETLKEQEIKELKIILKADVQGSTEALQDALSKLSTPEIKVNVIRSGTGAIIESDVLLASASKAIIIGFNVKPTQGARQLAETEGVDIKFYDIIYNALDDVKKAMLGLLEPVYEEKPLGRAEVRQVFSVPKVGNIAGCYVLEGLINRNAKIRLLRDSVVVYTGKVSSLKRFKDDVREVVSGYECGIGLDKFNDIKVGDIIEAYKMEEVAPTLSQLDTEQNQK